VPLGFRTDHAMVVSMSIPAYKYKGEDMMKELYEPLLERVQHLPGVESATLLTEVPLGMGRRGDRRLREEIEEHLAMQTEDNLRAGMPPPRRDARPAYGHLQSMRHATECYRRYQQTILRQPWNPLQLR
jgi:hypothetical protein